MRIGYVMVFVSNMQRSIAFYRDALGFPLRFESPGWTEFATEGATLALHAAGAQGQGPDAHRPEASGTCRPGFHVPDLDEFHRRMVAHQVECVQEPKETFGVRIGRYADPDGLVFAVSGP
jgi:lactoylglutathione lyase